MKNIKRIGAFFTLSLFLVIITVSCYGELDTQTIKSKMTFGDYLNDMSKFNGKGTILIQSNEYIVTQNNPQNINISERAGNPNAIKFFDENGNNLNILGDLTTEKKQSLYGKKLAYSILGGEKSSIYIPKLLQLEMNNDNILKQGVTINWNPDLLNEKGLIIWITYKPTSQNDMTIAKDNMRYITEGFVVEDTGSYTIKSSDLERFSNGAYVDVNIARTNYVINEIDKPSLIGFTTVTHNCLIEK